MRYLNKIIISLFLLAFLGQLFSTSIYAQNPDDKIGITVSPITDEFTIKPGETISRTVRVINPGEEVITLYPQTLNFTTDNENGHPVFFSSQDESSNYTLSSWVSFKREFIRIASNEEELVSVTISAPENAEPGGHYAAILFSTEEPDPNLDATEVGVVGLVGTLLLASVPGNVTEKLELEQFNLPLIAFSSPVKTSLTYKNNGNIHTKPFGEIVIKNWSGNQTGYLQINEGKGNILPQSRRRFENTWEFDPLKTLGFYTFSVQSTYGDGSIELNATKKILVIPYWLLAIVIIVLIYGSYKFIRYRKNKQRKAPPPIINNNKPKRILQ